MQMTQHTASSSLQTPDSAIDIRTLLKNRGFTLEGKTDASHPFELSRLILKHLAAYNSLRKHFFSSGVNRKKRGSIPAPALLKALIEQDWIKQNGSDYLELKTESTDVHRYLNGIWLEEYVWYAMKASGADEVMISQKIHWCVDGVDGLNEVDVIARYGAALTFVSCKTRGPADTAGATDQLSKQIYEVAYWKQHFLGANDRAILATTLDMIDEHDDHRERVPMVRARGSILGVEVLGYEDLLALADVTRQVAGRAA